MQYVRDMRVYNNVPRSQAIRNGWNIIKSRWIDINKGDDVNPKYRSRLVGKEFNTGVMEGLFAGTPPRGIQIPRSRACDREVGRAHRIQGHHDQRRI